MSQGFCVDCGADNGRALCIIDAREGYEVWTSCAWHKEEGGAPLAGGFETREEATNALPPIAAETA